MLPFPLSHLPADKFQYNVSPYVRLTCEPLLGEYTEEGCLKGRTIIKSFGTEYTPTKVEAYNREPVSGLLVPVATFNPMTAVHSGTLMKFKPSMSRGVIAYCPGSPGDSYVQVTFDGPADWIFGLPYVECIRYFYDALP